MADLPSVATATVNDVNAAYGDDGVRVLAYLRRHPEVVVSARESPLARSTRLLRESLAAYGRGQVQAAQELAVSAYPDGFELVEASLDTVNKRLRMTVEAEMLRYRAMLKSREPFAVIDTQSSRLQGLLAEAQHFLDRTRLPAVGVSFSRRSCVKLSPPALCGH